MDLSAIKQKLQAQQSNGREREKIDYEATFWKPSVGKHQIRIVPSMFNPEMPFSELYFHYGIGKYPMIALTNFGEQDPVVDFVNELRKTSDRDNWSLSGKLAPKMRVHAPVVVRGEEDKGVRLWGFGKQVYNTLLQLAADEDIGDFTDIMNGFDIVIEVVQGNPYPQTSVRIKPKQTPLSEDNAQVEAWTKTQPDPLKSFSKYDFDFIKRNLENWLSGNEDGDNTSTAPVTAAPAATQAPANNFTVETQAPKKADTVSQFDDLFGGSNNDLPF
jgi:hypothetical protein